MHLTLTPKILKQNLYLTFVLQNCTWHFEKKIYLSYTLYISTLFLVLIVTLAFLPDTLTLQLDHLLVTYTYTFHLKWALILNIFNQYLYLTLWFEILTLHLHLVIAPDKFNCHLPLTPTIDTCTWYSHMKLALDTCTWQLHLTFTTDTSTWYFYLTLVFDTCTLHKLILHGCVLKTYYIWLKNLYHSMVKIMAMVKFWLRFDLWLIKYRSMVN